MIAVIFEVSAGGRPQAGISRPGGGVETAAGEDRRLRLGGTLRSLYEPGKLLSISIWESEEAVAAWRRVAEHREAQARGRRELFADYRLRVAGIIRDYGSKRREEAPKDAPASVI